MLVVIGHCLVINREIIYHSEKAFHTRDTAKCILIICLGYNIVSTTINPDVIALLTFLIRDKALLPYHSLTHGIYCIFRLC